MQLPQHPRGDLWFVYPVNCPRKYTSEYTNRKGIATTTWLVYLAGSSQRLSSRLVWHKSRRRRREKKTRTKKRNTVLFSYGCRDKRDAGDVCGPRAGCDSGDYGSGLEYQLQRWIGLGSWKQESHLQCIVSFTLSSLSFFFRSLRWLSAFLDHCSDWWYV